VDQGKVYFWKLQLYRVFRAQADWTLTHMSHKDTEQSTVEASITLDGVTLTDSLIRWSPNEWPSVCREIPVSADKMFWMSNKLAQWTLYIDGHCQISHWNFNELCTTYIFLSVLFSFLFPATNLIQNIQLYRDLLYAFGYIRVHTYMEGVAVEAKWKYCSRVSGYNLNYQSYCF
jgi:hypothetical protein